MKLGGPWNSKGRRPRAHEPARDSGARAAVSNTSVGEWLNSVIKRSDGDDEPYARPRHEGPEANASGGQRPRRHEGGPYRGAHRDERDEHRHERRRDGELFANIDPNERRPEATPETPPRRDEFDDVNARLDKLGQQLEHLARVAAAPPEPPPAAARRERRDLPLTGGPTPARQRRSEPPDPPMPAPLPQRRRPSAEPAISIDDAVAEIAARQRVLDGQAVIADETAAFAQEPGPGPAPGPVLDFSSLEQQLRQITARIEALQPSHEIENAIAAVRSDLAEIGRQLNEALPRRALESLESEIKALAERIDLSRQAGVDPAALAGLERGLADVHEALRRLTPAENLVGADEAVHALAQKVDMILARDDPAMLQQLEAAIGALRGVVAHVASNDTLNRVAEDVRVLAAQVDAIANSAATTDAVASLEQRIEALTAALQASSEAGHVGSYDAGSNAATAHAVASLEQRIEALTAALQASSGAGYVASYDAGNPAAAQALAALEQRIDALTAALQASSDAGRAVPHDLEKLLAGLIDKLEWVQLTHTDHAALGHLEDRIAMLVKRFDASEARFGQLEAIERGLADLLVHIEQMRSANEAAAVPPAAWRAPPAVAGFEEQIAALGPREPYADDPAVGMRDTMEHVADRLAMIESNVYDSGAQAAPAGSPAFSDPLPLSQYTAAEQVIPGGQESAAPSAPVEATAALAVAAPLPTRAPIDPSLPPDHPLEPGFTGSRPRSGASAAERVAASEAALGSTKPPVIPDAGRPDFIAAARRAAQAASWEPSTAKAKQPEGAVNGSQPSKLSQRLRKLVVAGSAILIVLGCARIAMRLMDDGGTIGNPAPIHSEQAAAPAAPAPLADKGPAAHAPAGGTPLVPLPDPPGAAANGPAAQRPLVPLPDEPAAAAPPAPHADAKTGKPEQQSLQQPGAGETIAKATPPAGAEPAQSLPAWATPDITGTLPRSLTAAEKPRAAAPAPAAAAANDDDLPAAIGDPALRAAAVRGDPAAAYEIAARFAEGRGVAKNAAAAVHWLERAAAKGLAPAQFRLGGLYEKGIGVKKDLLRARELYLAAAQKGNGKAMHNLAVLYAEGADGTPDYTSAAEWFRRGADHGVSDSQYNLGILYARGIGVTQDYAESYKWFALAANQGDHDAAGKRDEVAGHLDAKALDAARTAVADFKAEPQPDDAVNVKTAAAGQTPPNAK